MSDACLKSTVTVFAVTFITGLSAIFTPAIHSAAQAFSRLAVAVAIASLATAWVNRRMRETLIPVILTGTGRVAG